MKPTTLTNVRPPHESSTVPEGTSGASTAGSTGRRPVSAKGAMLSRDAQKRLQYLARLGRARAAGSAAPAASEEAAQVAHLDFQKGEACARTNDYARARAFFEAALRGNPSRAEYKVALAATFVHDPRGKDLARAKELLDEAMRDPSCDRAFLLAGTVARAEKDEVRAERFFRAALRANPENPDAAREVRIADERRKRKGEERAFFKK